MRILVTGAGGMMGSHLLDFLIEKGHEVWGLDFVPTTDITTLNPKAKYFECDMRDKNKLTDVLLRFHPEIIFHLAAQSYPTVSWDRPEHTIDTNIMGTVHLFEAVKQLKLDPKIMVAGSSAVYGFIAEQDVPVKETQSLRPLHPYGISKVAQEMLAYQYFQNFKIRSTAVRIFNTTGPRKVKDVCSEFTERIVRMEAGLDSHSLRVGNIETRRAITDVRDVIQAFWLVVEKGLPGEIYNLSGDKVFSIREIIQMLRELTPVKFDLYQDPFLMRPTDEAVIYGNTDKFKAITNWQQTIPLKQTLQDMLNFWREKYGVQNNNIQSTAGPQQDSSLSSTQ